MKKLIQKFADSFLLLQRTIDNTKIQNKFFKEFFLPPKMSKIVFLTWSEDLKSFFL